MRRLWARWWGWWRRVPQPPPPPCEAAALEEARASAEEHLRRAHERAPEVARVSREARRYRHENHFAELIDAAFRAH